MGLLVFNLSYKTREIKQGRKDFFSKQSTLHPRLHIIQKLIISDKHSTPTIINECPDITLAYHLHPNTSQHVFAMPFFSFKVSSVLGI
jgi:hypothetical protein